MHRSRLQDVPEEIQRSPQGKFLVHRRNLSIAAGGAKDTGTWGGGHPFDVEWNRVPPGASAWPFHRHSAQWESYLILEGEGTVRTEDGTHAVAAGDFLVHPPGEAHALENTGTADLVYLVIADHPRSEVIEYPDSGKWFAKPQRRAFFPHDTPYYAGEEPDP